MKMDLTTVTLGALLIAGLCFEGLKHVTDDAPDAKATSAVASHRFDWTQADNESTPRASRGARRESQESTTVIPTPANPGGPTTSGKALPKAVAKIDKKKKAKKKKNDKKATPQTQVAKTPSKQSTPQQYFGGGVGGLPGAGQTKPVDPQDAQKTSLKDWEAFVLTNPSYENTLQLIEAYRSRQITADIFYTVVDEMLADGREEMRRYGVLSLQATPSVASLVRLEAHDLVEAEGTPAKALTERALNEYASPRYLPILAQVLTSAQNQQYAILAMQRLRKTAQGTTITSNPRQSRGNAQASADSISTSYARLAAVLTSVVQSYPNTQISQEAALTLAAIKRLQKS